MNQKKKCRSCGDTFRPDFEIDQRCAPCEQAFREWLDQEPEPESDPCVYRPRHDGMPD